MTEVRLKISVIIPVGDEAAWDFCRQSLEASLCFLDPKCGVDFEILPCFDLKHKGAFNARNEGLAKAKGDWIAWVDCDDVVERDWAKEIADAAIAHFDDDIIQFDTFENWNGNVRLVAYKYKGAVDGDSFAHELLRNDGMPAWLWTRVFKHSLFDDVNFEGRVKHDYGMFLKILSRVKSVWSIGKPLYCYMRNDKGLSAYAQQMDYAVAGVGFENCIAELPSAWRHDANVGLALTMADVARHSRCENGSRQFVRKYLRDVILDMKVPLRLKAKTMLAAMGL